MVRRQILGEPPQALEDEIVDAPMRNAKMLADDDRRSASVAITSAIRPSGVTTRRRSMMVTPASVPSSANTATPASASGSATA
jgi:hypothetical protein